MSTPVLDLDLTDRLVIGFTNRGTITVDPSGSKNCKGHELTEMTQFKNAALRLVDMNNGKNIKCLPETKIWLEDEEGKTIEVAVRKDDGLRYTFEDRKIDKPIYLKLFFEMNMDDIGNLHAALFYDQ